MAELLTQFDELVSILDEGDFQFKVSPANIPKSESADVLLRAIILRIAFTTIAKESVASKVPTANERMLGLCQFLALRPYLLPAFADWIRLSKSDQLELADWPLLPRGFFSDGAHRRTLLFLSARGIVCRVNNDHISWVDVTSRWGKLIESYSKNENLFVDSRESVLEFKKLSPTLKIFGIE